MTIYERINSELAGPDGFWSSDTEDRLHAAAKRLLLVGMGEEDAFAIIEDVFLACCSEYGE